MYLLDAKSPPTAHVPPTAAGSLMVAVNARASRAADPERLLAEILGHVRRAGARARGLVTEGESDLRSALSGAVRRVVLVGGDGTLHAAVNAAERLPEVALVPSGKANNVARALGIPGDAAAAARLAVTGTARPVDVVRVRSGSRTMRAVEGVSAGFQADARSRYSGDGSGDLLAGAGALAATVRRYRPYRVEVGLDGRRAFSGEAAQVFFSNLPFFGFGFRVDPIAHVSDGRIEAIVAQARSRFELMRLLADAYRGRHLKREGVTVRRAREAVIETPLPLVCDSTVVGRGTAEISVEPGRLRIVS
jgi:diacylglycerol kinase family enzyme